MAQLNAPIFGPDHSLVSLAAKRQLPRHQHMDLSTLRWIEDNRPQLPDTPTVGHPPFSVARYALVPSQWFAQPQQVDSIHGVRHGARVAVLAAQLARMLNLTVGETLEAVLAGALHDCRRIHDQDDPGHGSRAAAWFVPRAGNIIAHLPSAAREVRVHAVATAMELHDISYHDFNNQQVGRYASARTITDIVKTADALDRYRLPKLKWWPNHDHLKLTPPPWLHRYAFDLVIATERNRLEGMSSERAMVAILTEETS